MRVLIYIEPLVEREKPFWKRGWVDGFGPVFYNSLLRGGVKAEDMAFVVPEPFLEDAKRLFPGSVVATLPHAVFVPGMGDDALALARAWYEESLPPERDEYLAEQLRDTLGEFVPDVAVSYTPAPFLKRAWSRLPVVHFEVGMFSRQPYPMTVYLDPFGMFHRGAPARFGITLSARTPEPGEIALMNSIRKHFASAMFGSANPFRDSLKPELAGYARVALLVLQFSDFYAYDAHARFRSQYDWLIATLDSTPPDVALMVTEHPDHPLFDEETFAFLRGRYPNLIWMPQFREVYAATQFLIEYADTVITVSSSVGWQCLLWKKRLIICGSSHFDVIADSHDLADIKTVPDHDWAKGKDNLLAWLLSRYYIPLNILREDGWLTAYLERVIAAGSVPEGDAWFTQVADPAELEHIYQSHAESLLPPDPAPSNSKRSESPLPSMALNTVGESPNQPDVRLIAFYLPQFHRIPENDAWWGKGFTEWTNVAKARPLFPGHYQPQLPADLGFYDLRLPEAREEQAKLAKEYGIYGFCYYYYWFAGRRVLERPLQEVFESGKPDFPFCICWANEAWSRRWDGSENEVLLQQEHSLEHDAAFIHDVIPLLKDPRYIRVSGAPVLLIYRLTLMDDPRGTIERWREICARHGIERIHVCGVESFDIVDASQYGCDASVAFPPHGISVAPINKEIRGLSADFTGHIMDYRDVVSRELSKPVPRHKTYPGVMVAWDNTPRRGKAGNVFINSTPEDYEHWLSATIGQAYDSLPKGERLVFVNAWNEWAEGAHLEPDLHYGRDYLEATRRALDSFTDEQRGLHRSRIERRGYIADFAYKTWLKGHAVGNRECVWMAERLAARVVSGARFHLAIILPLEKIEFLLGTLESLENQLYVDGWVLTLIADIPEPAGLGGLPMLRWVERGNRSALAVVNEELSAVEADWVCMLEAGDRLPVHALFVFSEAMQRHPDWGMVYSDEDRLDQEGNRSNAFFKPDFSIDLIRGAPFSMGGLAIYRRDLFQRLSGFNPAMEGLEYWDIALRAHEQVGDPGIGHLADILYHRFSEGGHCEKAAADLEVAKRQVLAEHLGRLGLDADIRDGLLPGALHIRYRHTDQPLVSVIIPTKDQAALIQRCVESLLEKTRYPNYEILIVDNGTRDPEALAFLARIRPHPKIKVLPYPHPYNFSAMNNLAAREAKGDYLLLLNNDTATLHEDWLDEMMALGQRPEVGVVGARLIYPDGTLQHAGIFLGLQRSPAEHPYLGSHLEDPGYFGRTQLTQNFSAVTGACLLIRASLYAEVGGLDEATFGVSYNDVDICLKVRETGRLVVWTPYAMLLHEGSKSQRGGTEGIDITKRQARFSKEVVAAFDKWGHRIAFDPYYNRNLSLADRQVRIETLPALTWDPDWRPRPRILAHPADFHGCGEYRILAPVRALDKEDMAQLWATPKFRSVPELLRMQLDTVIFQRQKYGDQIEVMRNIYARFSQAFRVYEVDDLITNVPVKSRMKDTAISHQDLQRNFRAAVGVCNRLVVSTEYLAGQYKGYTDEIVVVPNYLPGSTWGALQPSRRQGGKPRVGWAGGSGHDGDLALIVDVVKATAHEVDWVFFGMCPHAIKEVIREYHPGVPLQAYPAKLASLDLDLAVAPLEDVPFNHAKSHLRLLEYGILGYPVICTDITPYQGSYPVTRVRNRHKDWVEAIREHVADLDELARRGDALRGHVNANWMLEDHLDAWLKAWLP